jgi:endonuclease/exonuclease/phosphatase family metal-dependent hydrolase
MVKTASALVASIVTVWGTACAATPAEAGGASVLRLLSFNINALPSAVKSGGEAQYNRIAEILRERRAAGRQPQIIVLQEAFNDKADVIAETTGYRYIVRGPGRREASKKGKAHWAMQSRKGYTAFTDPQKLTGSGLVILSDYPILEAHHKAFDSDMCAGFDCLSNKAILMARIEVPGLDHPLDVINSHFNSRGKAGAPSKWVLKAHQRQTDTLDWFLAKLGQGNPTVLAGDFNTRQSARFDYFREKIALKDTAEICLSLDGTCDVDAATKVSEILYDTNDKQFFDDSQCHGLTPVHIVRNFTEQIDGKPLSDHLGYEVHYRISPLDTTATAAAAAADRQESQGGV